MPLQSMGKVGFTPHSSDYLFNIELWHDSLFRPTAELPTSEAAPAAAEHEPPGEKHRRHNSEP